MRSSLAAEVRRRACPFGLIRDAVGARHVRHPRVQSPGRASQNELGTGDRSGPGRRSVRPRALVRRRSAVQSRPWAPLSLCYKGSPLQEGDLSVADQILTPDFVNHGAGIPPELAQGPEGANRFAQAIRTGFGNEVNISHDDVIVHGDRVVIRWSTWGTHKGDLLGVPATGKPIKITGIDVFRVQDGKLAELWQNWDQLQMLQQIGAVPEPQSAGV